MQILNQPVLEALDPAILKQHYGMLCGNCSDLKSLYEHTGQRPMQPNIP